MCAIRSAQCSISASIAPPCSATLTCRGSRSHQNAIDADLLPGAGERLDQAHAGRGRFRRGWLGADRLRSLCASRRRHGTRCPGGNVAAEFPGLYHRRGRYADRYRRLLDRRRCRRAISRTSRIWANGRRRLMPGICQWCVVFRSARTTVCGVITIMQLMAGLQVDLAAMARAHGQKPALFDAALMALEPLVADGLCRIEGLSCQRDTAGAVLRAQHRRPARRLLAAEPGAGIRSQCERTSHRLWRELAGQKAVPFPTSAGEPFSSHNGLRAIRNRG